MTLLSFLFFHCLPVTFSFVLPATSSASSPGDVKAMDKPNDAGSAIQIFWTRASNDSLVENYVIMRKAATDPSYQRIGSTAGGVSTFEDDGVTDGTTYTYLVASLIKGMQYPSEQSNNVTSKPQLFHTGRINVLAALITFTLLLAYFVYKARSGKNLYIRQIAGLAAVEEAVGRATEMGRPILYVPGLGDIDWTATIASMNILGEVAKKIALYDTELIVPNTWSVVYTVSKEVVKESFMSEGRPEKFKEDYVRYVTEAQFGFAAAVNGIMIREKPATNFFVGKFWAESLIMAETGAQTGAFQIAGTDSVLQLPFFVTACDYTLMGEELYAASAYLSREPVLLGSLKAQDYGKLMSLIILGGLSILAFLRIDLLYLLKVQ
ncbi:MAG: fibronectin type III domain-containing protein [candidate division WOR-3 bacterium]|nr:MAG: fibronectin type III domain-containing protein [candidate division WOR-3 bacterium]